MPVPSNITDLSTTAASNSPAGSDSIGTSLDDHIRALGAIIKQNASSGSDITSSSTITIPSSGSYFTVTGSTTITAINDSFTGRSVCLKFSGTPQLTHGAGFILPGAANITAAAGDTCVVVNESTGVWRCVFYQPVGGNLTSTSIGVTVQAYDADIPTVSASQAEMKAGTEAALRSMSPLRVRQAIEARVSALTKFNQTLPLTLALSHAGNLIWPDSTGTITIPANASVAFPVGTAITITNFYAAITIAITTDTMYFLPSGGTGNRTLAQYGTCTLVKITANAWQITGVGLS